jgi:hypothetical protein
MGNITLAFCQTVGQTVGPGTESLQSLHLPVVEFDVTYRRLALREQERDQTVCYSVEIGQGVG